MLGRTNTSLFSGIPINANTAFYEVAPGNNITVGDSVDFWHELYGAYGISGVDAANRMLFKLSDGRYLAVIGNNGYVFNYSNGVYYNVLSPQKCFSADYPVVELEEDNFLFFNISVGRASGSTTDTILLYAYWAKYDVTNNVWNTSLILDGYDLPDSNTYPISNLIYSYKFDMSGTNKYVFFNIGGGRPSYSSGQLIKMQFTIAKQNGSYVFTVVKKRAIVSDYSSTSHVYREVSLIELLNIGTGHLIFFGNYNNTADKNNRSFQTRVPDTLIYRAYSDFTTGGSSYTLSPNNYLIPIGFDNETLSYIAFELNATNVGISKQNVKLYYRKAHLFDFGTNTFSLSFYDRVEIYNFGYNLFLAVRNMYGVDRSSMILLKNNTSLQYLLFFISSYAESTQNYKAYQFILKYDKATGTISVEDVLVKDVDINSIPAIVSGNNVKLVGRMTVDGTNYKNAIGDFVFNETSKTLSSSSYSKDYVEKATDLKFIRGISTESGTSGDTIEIYVPLLS